MPICLPQEFLREHSLQDLIDRTKIQMARHQEHPNLVLLKYDQIHSPMGDPIVQHCRGLILDEEDGWRVVSFPYTKFFNHGEGHAHEIDWQTARVYEKLDGSLITLYHYKDEWHVSSSGNPDAGGNVHGSSKTFRQLFWETFHGLGYNRPEDTSMCYMFELMTPENRVVIPHKTNRLVLHGARRLEDGYWEVSPEDVANRFGWECVKTFPFDDLQGILAMADVQNGMECEGFVVCDENFSRLKIKAKAYVALHHLKASLSIPRLVEIVQANEDEEFLRYFPEYKDIFLNIKNRFRRLCDEAESVYRANKEVEVQKDFAIAVKDLPYSGALFATRAGKVASVETWFRQYDAKKVLALLEEVEREKE